MNYTLFVCMKEQNIQKFKSQEKDFEKFMFTLGFDLSMNCFLNDLLMVDYNSFGQGLKIFLEDEGHKASDLLIPLNQLKSFDDVIFYDEKYKILVIRYFDINTAKMRKFVSEHFNLVHKILTFKTFGLSKETILKYLTSYKRKNNIFDYYIAETNLDALILIRFLSTVEVEKREQVVQKIMIEFEKVYYSDRDITLSNAVCEILGVQKLKIALVENFTSGLIASTLLIENTVAKEFICDTYIISDIASKLDELKIDRKQFELETAVSSSVAVKMAIYGLTNSSSDIVIATTGYDNHANPELKGLFYTAVGDSIAVNVYKHKFSGSKEEIIKYGVNVALFETIKKLNQNALKKIDFVV